MDKKARQAWHGPGADLEFDSSDFEIVDLVLGQIPELRICAIALKRFRALKLKFPVKSQKSLNVLIGNKSFKGGGHIIGTKDIARYMPSEFFPISDEGELVSRVYIALIRCKHEAAMKVNASRYDPKNQEQLPQFGGDQ